MLNMIKTRFKTLRLAIPFNKSKIFFNSNLLFNYTKSFCNKNYFNDNKHLHSADKKNDTENNIDEIKAQGSDNISDKKININENNSLEKNKKDDEEITLDDKKSGEKDSKEINDIQLENNLNEKKVKENSIDNPENKITSEGIEEKISQGNESEEEKKIDNMTYIEILEYFEKKEEYLKIFKLLQTFPDTKSMSIVDKTRVGLYDIRISNLIPAITFIKNWIDLTAEIFKTIFRYIIYPFRQIFKFIMYPFRQIFRLIMYQFSPVYRLVKDNIEFIYKPIRKKIMIKFTAIKSIFEIMSKWIFGFIYSFIVKFRFLTKFKEIAKSNSEILINLLRRQYDNLRKVLSYARFRKSIDQKDSKEALVSMKILSNAKNEIFLYQKMFEKIEKKYIGKLEDYRDEKRRRRRFLFRILMIIILGRFIYKLLNFEIKFTYYDQSNQIIDKNKEIKDEKSNVNANNRQNNIQNIIKSKEFSFAKDIKERLDDIRGIDEVKEEIQQLISMIKDPLTYYMAGAKLPKGVLLSGKPGTGKTLIARAIAGESGVNFMYMTGSDFDEMFVGMGASRIRQLFSQARKNMPCIIFIDEIDSLLSKSRRSGGEHSSSRATLNQFLAEMDGFDKLDNILVIGATNHEKELDPAAIRPGRFDSKIYINIPDEKGRIDIINFYLDKIKMEKENLEPQYIARLTPGFTGAEIENLVNLSIIHAVNTDKAKVDMEDFFEARDRVLMGLPRKNFSTSEKKRYHTSLHEAGHTLMCYKSPICRKTLHKVTIIPRGGAAGVTLMLSDEESLNSKLEFLTNIDTCMGGHVAEELIYGSNNVTAGCSSDLNKASQIAQSMVKNFGMYGENVGYIYVEDEGYSWEEDEISNKYKSSIDETIKKVLKESHDRVYNSLKESANELKNLAQKLYQFDTLNIDEIEAAIEGRFDYIKRDEVRKEYEDKDNLN